MVGWVAAVYHARDAEQWVAEGPAAFQVSVDDGQALLVRRRTGQYWSFPGANDLYTARSDWRLRRSLRKLFIDVDSSAGVVHDPARDLSEQQLRAWLDATYGAGLYTGQIHDRGWAFLAVKGPVEYGGMTGRPHATFAVVKRTGEVWDLMQGTHAEAAYYARTEAGFRRQIAAVASGLQPIARITG